MQHKELFDASKKHLEQLLQMNLFHLNPEDSGSLEQFSHPMNSYQHSLMTAAHLHLHPQRSHDSANNNNNNKNLLGVGGLMLLYSIEQSYYFA